MSRKAVFLDRDGTINEDIGDLYSVDKLVFIPDALKALRMLQEKFLLFIITNQAGIGKKVFTEEDFFRFNKEYIGILEKEGIKIQQVYYCPHKKEEDCLCRKPKTYFVIKAEKDFDLDLEGSYIIGDHPGDVEMAGRVGAKGIFLLTGHGKSHLQEIRDKPEYLIAENIYEAALIIDNK